MNNANDNTKDNAESVVSDAIEKSIVKHLSEPPHKDITGLIRAMVLREHLASCTGFTFGITQSSPHYKLTVTYVDANTAQIMSEQLFSAGVISDFTKLYSNFADFIALLDKISRGCTKQEASDMATKDIEITIGFDSEATDYKSTDESTEHMSAILLIDFHFFLLPIKIRLICGDNAVWTMGDFYCVEFGHGGRFSEKIITKMHMRNFIASMENFLELLREKFSSPFPSK
jgi:hypothetical protein